MGEKGSKSERSMEEGDSRASKRRRPTVHPIETANKASNDDFIKEYMRPSENWKRWQHPRTGARYTLSLHKAGDLSAEEMRGCFDLVQDTSAEDYRNSSVGWSPAAKKKEMRSADLRYILVRLAEEKDDDAEGGDHRDGDDDGGTKGGDHYADGDPTSRSSRRGMTAIKGFASLMPTFENDEPVVYCYEVHVESGLQGTGLGRLLMNHVTDIAEHMPAVDKTMLTCFVSNPRARRFYDKLGFETDASSPGDRVLRGGRVVAPDYVILSRRTTGGRGRGRGRSRSRSSNDNSNGDGSGAS